MERRKQGFDVFRGTLARIVLYHHFMTEKSVINPQTSVRCFLVQRSRCATTTIRGSMRPIIKSHNNAPEKTLHAFLCAATGRQLLEKSLESVDVNRFNHVLIKSSFDGFVTV